MALDPVRVADTRAWLVKASRDLRGAEIDLAADPPLLDDVVFHCQQAVEEALKGYLTWNDQPFRRTHDLVDLGGRCVAIDPTLDPLLRRAAGLTEYAWKFRYPGEPGEPTDVEAADSLALAREVVSTMLGKLPAEARP